MPPKKYTSHTQFTHDFENDIPVQTTGKGLSKRALMMLLALERKENTNPKSGPQFRCPVCETRYSMSWGVFVVRKNFADPEFVCKDCQHENQFRRAK